ncbi:hypothetical protein D1012_06565 [Pseudotabrizicola alkalilacus]|uniref:Uncharacterized protein n=1 Tax=Pseudotabrizicola alkalilacus TaxID=2305252 RepID=A0A411Z5W6_9RHOB|nr:hypothetical protein D1012_06565 [Pseudotabrizicola alkalilacus]
MTVERKVTPLTKERAFATIQIVAKAALSGEQALTYSDLARRLGMSKVNGQGLSSYLNEAAAMCAEHGHPNVSVLVVSKESLDRGAPMPSEGSFADGFYASTGLTQSDIPAEQDRVRAYDWRSVKTLALD